MVEAYVQTRDGQRLRIRARSMPGLFKRLEGRDVVRMIARTRSLATQDRAEIQPGRQSHGRSAKYGNRYINRNP